MNKKISVVIVIFFLTLSVTADDGSWSKSFSIQGGAIYSETDHPDVELEKELLVFNGETTVAVFQFKNTSNRAVTVECGFPVRHKIHCYDCGAYLEIPSSPYGGGEIPSLKWLETEDITDPEGFDPPGVAILLNDYNNSREFIPPEQAVAEVDFSITRDGEDVEVQDVLLDRQASSLGAAVTYHFRHKLVFSPGEEAIVAVEYRQNLITGSDGMSDSYGWDYVIGTGATWKGPIGEFMLVVPAGWRGYPAYLEFIEEAGGFLMFVRRNYEPDRVDTFSLTGFSVGYMEKYEYVEKKLPKLKKMWRTGSREVMQPTEPVQSMIREVSASSSLADRLNIFTEEGVVDGAGFTAISAFDGLPETSWCEGFPGDGIDEYLECTLTGPVWGITLQNGFTRFPASDWMFFDDTFERSVRDDGLGVRDYFSMNNRVKTLEITSPEGTLRYSLSLADRRDPQTFAGIFLPAGTLRFIIREVYPGSRWSDTCLAELGFLPYPDSDAAEFLEDPFFRDNLSGLRF